MSAGGEPTKGSGEVMVDKLGNCEKLEEGEGMKRVKCLPVGLLARSPICALVELQLGTALGAIGGGEQSRTFLERFTA